MAIDSELFFQSLFERSLEYFNRYIQIDLKNCNTGQKDKKQIALYDVSLSIAGNQAFDGVVVLSLQNVVADILVDKIFGEYGLELDTTELKLDLIGEILNILVGNALSAVSCQICSVTFDLPQAISDIHTLMDKNGKIAVADFSNQFGMLNIIYIYP